MVSYPIGHKGRWGDLHTSAPTGALWESDDLDIAPLPPPAGYIEVKLGCGGEGGAATTNSGYSKCIIWMRSYPGMWTLYFTRSSDECPAGSGVSSGSQG